MFEFNSPLYYIRPSKNCSSLIRENWIRAKYVRKEFCPIEGQAPEEGAIIEMPEQSKQGFLLKRNNRNRWQKRWFVLHKNVLYYYKGDNDSYSKGQIFIQHVKVEVPRDTDKDKKFSFHITTANREYVLAAEDAASMFDWCHALLRVAIFYSKIEKPMAEEKSEQEVDVGLSFSQMGKPIKVGELIKQTGHMMKSWKKRFGVVTEHGVLYYFKSKPTSGGKPESGISLRSANVMHRSNNGKYIFNVVAPTRVYFFEAPNEKEEQGWIDAIRKYLDSNHPKTKVNFKSEELAASGSVILEPPINGTAEYPTGT